MAKVLFKGILVVAAAISLQACGYYHETKGTGPAPAPFTGNQTLGFEVVKTIFQRNRCFECHSVEKGNQGGVNLETHARTQPWAEAVLRTTVSGFMPRGGPRVPAGDQEILQAWVDAKAPEFSNLPLPGKVQDPGDEPQAPGEEPQPGQPGPLNFATVKAAIFTPHCIGCHSQFADYRRVASQLEDIQTAVDLNFMPKNSPPLSAELKDMLAEWIAGGAPEF